MPTLLAPSICIPWILSTVEPRLKRIVFKYRAYWPFIVNFIAQNDAEFLTSIISAKNYTFLLPNITENDFNNLLQLNDTQYIISILIQIYSYNSTRMLYMYTV